MSFPTDPATLGKLLADVKDWRDVADDGLRKRDPLALAFMGTTDGWMFLVTGFSIESQGFPKGSLGFDGTASKAGTILRLSSPELRAVAEQGVKLARASTEKKS